MPTATQPNQPNQQQSLAEWFASLSPDILRSAETDTDYTAEEKALYLSEYVNRLRALATECGVTVPPMHFTMASVNSWLAARLSPRAAAETVVKTIQRRGY